ILCRKRRIRSCIADRMACWCMELDADQPAWAAPVFGGEVAVAATLAEGARFAPLPEHPAVVRDLALLLADGRAVAEVLDLLRLRGSRLGVESLEVLSEFRGGALPVGRRSVAVRLTFRVADRTLTDVEVDKAVSRLISMLERELDVSLRSA
ncbi:MAG TPA: hypothetical protein PLL69_10455, partial [Gemmatimonadales bacterium]|nr:hypothetical protein [Gemmatimonadales bacterium]